MGFIVLTFGLIAGVILSVMMAVTLPFIDDIGFDKGEIIGYTSMLAAFLLIYFGIRQYRDKVAGGQVSFGRAFAVGMSIAAVAALCYDVTWLVIYSRTGPEFATRYQAHVMEKARAEGKSQAELDAQAAELKRNFELYQNPAIRFGITFLEPMPVGLIVSLVSAGVLSRRRRNGLSSSSAPAPA
jgi:hypothetical protein